MMCSTSHSFSNATVFVLNPLMATNKPHSSFCSSGLILVSSIHGEDFPGVFTWVVGHSARRRKLCPNCGRARHSVKYIAANTVAAGNSSILIPLMLPLKLLLRMILIKLTPSWAAPLPKACTWCYRINQYPRSIPVFAAVDHVQSDPELFATTEIQTELDRLYLSIEDFSDDMSRLMLLLEDRRCDHWMYQRAPGYRPVL
jgi:hypothetical protein